MTKAPLRVKKSQLGRMVQEAIVALPFATEVLGVPVVVERIKMGPRGEIRAVCRRGKMRQAVPILDLPLPAPAPEGARWIEAYRHWSLGG